MQLFAITSPLSQYLQTSGLDLLTAKRLIKDAAYNITKLSRSFDDVLVATNGFVSWVKEQVRNPSLDIDEGERNDILGIEEKLPQKRNNPNPLGKFKVDVYNVVMDTVGTSFNNRFLGVYTKFSEEVFGHANLSRKSAASCLL